ncbi:MAG: ThiF family adenylyltransferase [Dehalococcoidia bacterium]|nr:ThiF family adenylyltransferase [Dehalococcoidia bacterium]
MPAERLASKKITVIGVGAIGRQVALQLAAIGAQHLQLIDDDIVDESNIASQGYYESDLGKPKVSCTAIVCHLINKLINVELYHQKFNGKLDSEQSQVNTNENCTIGDTIFCCVDSITTRKEIWESVHDKVDFFCDGRMAAESLRVLMAHDAESREHYPTTLFAQEEAFQGSCTAKSTIYCANVAAGIMVAQFAKHLRGLLVEADISYNLQTQELAILKE